ncbi:MAG: hypothetical protein PVS3B3_35870 [Ktedonobacteraceae bacterium]
MQTEEPAVVTPENIEPKTQSWRDIVQPWWKVTLSILPIFLLTRFLFILLAYVGGVLFTAADFAATSVSYHDLLANWNRGDVTRYLTIATNGYTQTEQTLLFPLYPTLIRTLAPLFRQSQLTTGFFLSNLAFLGILIVLYRLVAIEFDRDTAIRATLYIAIFPTAFLFFIAYSESLFLFFALVSFYSMRRGAWWLAGLFGALATLTQFAGLFLFMVFLCEFVRQTGPQMQHAWKEHSLLQRIRPALPALAALPIPLALTLYFSALHTLFGDPFVFIRTQRQDSAGFSSLFLALKALVSQPHLSVVVAHTLLDVSAFVLFIMLMVLCFFGPERFLKGQWTFAVFGVLLLFSALLFSGHATQDSSLNEPLALMPRLVISIFPGFIVLARFGRRVWFHQSYLLLTLPMLAFFVLQFITGHWTL